MLKYRHILLAINLTDEMHQVIERAEALQKTSGARLSILHVTESINLSYAGDTPMDSSEVQEQIHDQVKTQLAELGLRLSVPEEQQYLAIGRPEIEIRRLAEEEDCDLIVVGSHGRQGLALLLGSTVNGVLHGATRDVLAVRLAEA